MLAALAASVPAAVAHADTNPYGTSSYRILSNPTGGDDFLFRNAIHGTATDLTGRLFNALVSVLGGTAPTVNFVPVGDPSTPTNYSSTPSLNRINMNPIAVEALTNYNSAFHNPGVIDVDHEMAHLRQTPQVLADPAQREGGAQAFSDLVTPTAAQRAGIPFTPGSYDANYADYVRQVQANLGRDFILGGQFGHAPVQYP